MSMEVDFSEPYLETIFEPGTPPLVPQYMEVSIAGRNYVLDTSFEPYRRDAFRHRSIQAQRESISLTDIPGQGTVNTEGLWRREADDWAKASGQPYQDRKDSLDSRYSISKGINPWMQWQTSLLSDTRRVVILAGDARVCQAGPYIYVADFSAGTLKYSSDLTTWHTVTGITGNPTAMATDGYDVWLATTTNVYATIAGASSATVLFNSGALTGLWYVGDRLMGTVFGVVFDLSATTPGVSPPALPTPLWTHPNPGFFFSSMCDGSSQIYIGGYVLLSGQPRSVVYRTSIEQTGMALTIPVQALPMEGGEFVSSLQGYLNFVFVGSNLGVRMCRTIAAFDPTGNEGDLEAGPLIPGLFPPGPVNLPVSTMVGNNRFMYFGWSNFDNVSTGLGRLDLSTFIDTQAPAVASDLMVTARGTVNSMDWCSITNAPIFVIGGSGVYTSTNTPVQSGFVQSGYIEYGIPDDKIALGASIGTVQPQQGTVSMSLASDASSNIFAFVGQQNSSATGGTPNDSVFPINSVRGKAFTVKMTLTRDPVSGESPILHRWTLKAIPAIVAGTTVSVVIRMWTVEEIAGGDYEFDPYLEKQFLESLRTTQTVFSYTEGPLTYENCVVDEIDWLPEKRRDANIYGGFQGDIIVYIKTFDLGT